MIRLLLAAVVALAAAPVAAFTSDRIAVTVVGTGSDVILVPGLNSAARDWDGLVRDVPGHRYHLVQVRGFAGVAPAGNASGNVAAPVAEEIVRYVAEERLHPALIGHSMGGTIGMMVAARHPAALSRLMVVDMPPFMGLFFAPTPDALPGVADRIAAAMRDPDPARRRAGSTATINGMVNTAAMRPVAIADTLTSDPDTGARAMRELILTDLRPELARITVPTTVLYVTPNAVPVTPEQTDATYRTNYANLKGVELQRIDDSAHFMMWDQPARFADAVRRFLG